MSSYKARSQETKVQACVLKMTSKQTKNSGLTIGEGRREKEKGLIYGS